MNQTLLQGEAASISRDFAVGPGQEPAVIIETAGEPLFGLSRSLDDGLSTGREAGIKH
jgi:hypothetical protein